MTEKKKKVNNDEYVQYQSFFSRSLGTCFKCTNYDWYHCQFHFKEIFRSLARSRYLSMFLLSFIFPVWPDGTAKSTRWQILFYLLIKTKPDLRGGNGWFVCISKSWRISSSNLIVVFTEVRKTAISLNSPVFRHNPHRSRRWKQVVWGLFETWYGRFKL